MTLRVHLVSEHASPLALLGGVDAGGQNVHVAALATGLARLGADVVVHTRRDDPSRAREVEFAPGVLVDHVDAGPPVPLPKDRLLPYMGEFADDLTRRWRARRPDVVHAHFWMSGLAAVEAGDRLDVPVALTYHALGVEKQRHQRDADTSPAGRLATEQWLAAAVDRVIATTAAERRTLVAMGSPGHRVDVLPCGVDLERFRPDGPAYAPRRGRRRIVCVSRLVRRKGIDDVVAALTQVPDAELLVAGGPPAAMLPDDAEATYLRELAEELGVADRVELLGAVDRHQVPSLLRSADVVCCTPWYEPFGLVAVEAMACGVPVVASRVGGLAETVRDGVTGFLVAPREPAAIAEALHRVLDQPELAVSMRAQATRRASRYGWDLVAERTLQVLTEVARLGRGRTTPVPRAATACRTEPDPTIDSTLGPVQ